MSCVKFYVERSLNMHCSFHHRHDQLQRQRRLTVRAGREVEGHTKASRAHGPLLEHAAMMEDLRNAQWYQNDKTSAFGSNAGMQERLTSKLSHTHECKEGVLASRMRLAKRPRCSLVANKPSCISLKQGEQKVRDEKDVLHCSIS